MTKVGNKHKTKAFGDACETYLAKLLSMRINPSGSIRPDLITDSEIYEYPRPFSVEVKGGKRGILLKSQLSYGINDISSWRDFFGENRGNPLSRNGNSTMFVEEGHRVFYGLVERVDGLPANKVVGDFATVRFRWGDVYLIPTDLVFHYFAAVLARKNNQPIGRVENQLRNFVRRCIKSGSSLSDERDKDSWISLPFSSVRAMFEGSHKGIVNETQKGTLDKFFRVARDRTEYDSYERVQINGLGEHKIYLIHNKKHKDVAGAIEEVIHGRIPSLEDVRLERDEMKEWLEKNKISLGIKGHHHCYNGRVDDSRRKELVRLYGERWGIDSEKIDLLERLVRWETPEEFEQRTRIEREEDINAVVGVPF
ncbi:MAG: hypothetical protein AABW89_06145 [Nanoarchaeota archaeon]